MKICVFHTILIITSSTFVHCLPGRKDINVELMINVDGCGGDCCSCCSGTCESQPETGNDFEIKTTPESRSLRASNVMHHVRSYVPKETGPNYTMTICLKNICVHSCEMNGYSNGFCMNPTSCYCFEMVWNITMTNCFDALCQHECEKYRYMSGTCIDLGTCHCYGTKTTSSVHESTAETTATVRMKFITTPTKTTPRSCFDDCNDNCSEKGFKKGVCNGESCHCYYPEPWMPDDATKIPPELWTDITQKPCKNEECTDNCRDIGFSKGACADSDTCHCYGPNDQPHESTTEKVKTKLTTTTTQPTPRSCFDDCKGNCSEKGFKKGVCEGESCHCYDPESWMPHDTTKGPTELWSDRTQEPCKNEGCTANCRYVGFSKGTCKDSDSCHCYGVYSYGSYAPTGKMSFRNAVTIPTTNIPQEYVDMHLGDKVCTRMVCRMLCSEKRLSKGFCIYAPIGGNMCHCFDPILSNDTTLGPRGGWKNEPTLDKCLINICALKCNVSGFLKGACIDEKVCHCYDPRRVRELRKLETNNTQPIVAIALPMKALLDTSLVIEVPVCLNTKCRILCRNSSFRKGRCESDKKCRCSQKILSPIHKNNIELRMLPKGIKKTAITTTISAENFPALIYSTSGLTLDIPPKVKFPTITSLSPPFITFTRDPLLDMFTVINMQGCVQRKCRIKCSQSYFRKSHCEGNRCHCQEKIARTNWRVPILKNKKKRAM